MASERLIKDGRNQHGQFVSRVAQELCEDDDMGFAAMNLGLHVRQDHRQALKNREAIKAEQNQRRAANRRRYFFGEVRNGA